MLWALKRLYGLIKPNVLCSHHTYHYWSLVLSWEERVQLLESSH